MLNWRNLAFIVLVFAIAVLAVYFRTTMLQYFGFYEPDGFYYFSVIRATVNNHFVLPQNLSTSGYPNPTQVAEAHGVYYTVLIPYAVLQYFGVSYYTIMRLVPVAFALLDMLGAYLLSRYLSKDKLLGLLTLLFVALSMGNAARTSALIFRGDTFVTFFLVMALVFFVEVFRQTDRNRKIMFAAAAGIALLFSNLVWNGASFADAIFMLSFAVLMLAAFMFRKDKIIDDGRYILASIFLWLILANIASAVGFIPGQQLVSASYLPIYVLIAIVWLAVYFISRNIVAIMRSPLLRIGLPIIGIVLAAMVLFFADPGLVNSILVGNGFVTAPGSFASTTQELQPPNIQFLATSFGPNLFTAIPTLFLAASYQFNFQNPVWIDGVGILGVIVLFALFIPYFLMQIYDSGGLFGGKAKIRLELSIPMIVIMCYFVLTSYLQVHAIRYNSVISIPIAMISAYTLYWIISYVKNVDHGLSAILSIIAVPIVFVGISVFSLQQTPYGLATYAIYAIAILATLGALYVYSATGGNQADKIKTVRYLLLAQCAVLLLVVMVSLLFDANLYSSGLVQADSINPQFISALQWLGSNSPANSSVLTLWPDGSVVEGVANRIVVMDSVGAENASKATPFAAWLLNDSPDPQFLASRINGNPDYLLTRTTWLQETQGIYTEANITTNESLYGYVPLQSFGEEQLNATTRQIRFTNTGTYPYVVVDITSQGQNSTESSVYSYIEISPTQTSPFSQASFYDSDNGNFTIINQNTVNSTNGETLLVQYSGIPKQGLFINLTGAYIFAPAIANSNMLKFLYFCNEYYCAWDNNQSKMQLVYENPDTRIFRIVYNSTG